MYISKVEVASFKSYYSSGEVEFKPGINIVVGQNSAGKTALLEAMQLIFPSNPHRSLKTVTSSGGVIGARSFVRLTLVLTRDELQFLLKNTNYYSYAAPATSFSIPGFGLYNETAGAALAFLKWLFSQVEFCITIECLGSGVLAPVENRFGLYPAAPVSTEGQQKYILATCDANGVFTFVKFTNAYAEHDVTVQIASRLRSRIYRFLAERFNFGDSPVGTERVLKPNAENLPEVLDLLKGNSSRMERFNRVVREILPSVQHVSVTKIPTNPIKARILVWPHDYKTEREDLANPLNECGSGVGQVLAILYVVMNSNEPQVILIDEPQSFLHPGAVRKLIEVLKGFPQHQYIIATHSSAVINAADPATLTIVRASDGESKLETIDPRSAKHARALLTELGARLSDVFGADDIIWVEGQTEEQCFPMILRQVAKRSLMGTAIVGIKRTGDLQGRDKKKWMEMHRKLSDANTLIPPTIAFAFDGECLTEPKKADLCKLAPGRVHFLPRRMYENYLLDPEAIASVVTAISGFRDQPITTEEVRQWLAKRHQERKGNDPESKQLRYFCEGITAVPEGWQCAVDAASLLKDLFEDLSETRVSFEKTTHSVDLTEWLVEHKPEALKELSDFVASLVATKQDGVAASASMSG